MAVVVNTNIGSMNAQRALTQSSLELRSAMERLSSGKKINSAADDAAGFAIAERMTSQVRGLTLGVKNANDAISFLSVAENASQEITDLLQRINELAIQAGNGSYSIDDKNFLQLEVKALTEEIDRIANKTMFNGEPIFGPGSPALRQIQVGVNDGDTVTVSTFPTSSMELIGGLEGEILWGDVDGIVGPSGSPPPSDVSDTDFTITSSSGSAVIDVVSGDSALQVAQKVNAEFSETGVFATAVNVQLLINIHPDLSEERVLSLNINGVSTGNFLWSGNGDPAEEAINKITDHTGVRASSFDGGVALISLGEDITVEVENSIAGNAFLIGGFSPNTGPYVHPSAPVVLTSDPGSDSATMTGMVRLSSKDTFTAERIGANAPEFFDTTAFAQEGFPVDLNSLPSLTSIPGTHWEFLRHADLTISPELVSSIAQDSIQKLSQDRASYGASLNRLDYVVSNLLNVIENTEAARSRIQDADFAVEAARLAKAQVLQQSGTAMLSQANATPKLVLSLLKVA